MIEIKESKRDCKSERGREGGWEGYAERGREGGVPVRRQWQQTPMASQSKKGPTAARTSM